MTRVSLDLRVITDQDWDPAAAGDRFSATPGYYVRYERRDARGNEAWTRCGEMPAPDSRFGYPFTSRHHDQ